MNDDVVDLLMSASLKWVMKMEDGGTWKDRHACLSVLQTAFQSSHVEPVAGPLKSDQQALSLLRRMSHSGHMPDLAINLGQSQQLK